MKNKINSKGTVWAKDKVKRFKLEQLNNIGPGKYAIEGPKKPPIDE